MPQSGHLIPEENQRPPGRPGMVGFVHLASLFSRDPGVLEAEPGPASTDLDPAQRAHRPWSVFQLPPREPTGGRLKNGLFCKH